MRRIIIQSILIVAAICCFGEFALRIRGIPISSSMYYEGFKQEEFEFVYIDIYKPIYKKEYEKGKWFYVRQKDRFNCEKFPVFKSPDKSRIFILGGSVAKSWETEKFEEMFNKLFIGKKAEIINCGMGGFDAYRTALIAKEVLQYEPDLIIVLSGNNEFYEQAKVNPTVYNINSFLRKSWLYSTVQDLFLAKLLSEPRNGKDRRVGYEKHIRQIAKMAKRGKVPLVLCTMPFNFKDYPPVILPNEPEFSDELYISATFLLERGRYLEAASVFKQYLMRCPASVLGNYYLGKTYEKIKDYEAAKEYYLLAVDLSANRWASANPSSNEIIRQICREEEIGLADLENAFMDIAEQGLIGREQLLDNCHWWLDHYLLVAQVVLRTALKNKLIYSEEIVHAKTVNAAFLSSRPKFLSLKERGQRQEDEGLLYTMIWEAMGYEGKYYSETVLAYCETIYKMNPALLWDIQSQENLIAEAIIELENYDIVQFLAEADFNLYWYKIFSHIGEAYRRMGLYNEALSYYNRAAVLVSVKNGYLPYLGQALAYYALGEKQNAIKNITLAQKISNNKLIASYKKILGL
ncbi:MAG: hypothetical protein ABII75_01345 [Candidatus Omnitrophota bacterium]